MEIATLTRVSFWRVAANCKISTASRSFASEEQSEMTREDILAFGPVCVSHVNRISALQLRIECHQPIAIFPSRAKSTEHINGENKYARWLAGVNHEDHSRLASFDNTRPLNMVSGSGQPSGFIFLGSCLAWPLLHELPFALSKDSLSVDQHRLNKSVSNLQESGLGTSSNSKGSNKVEGQITVGWALSDNRWDAGCDETDGTGRLDPCWARRHPNDLHSSTSNLPQVLLSSVVSQETLSSCCVGRPPFSTSASLPPLNILGGADLNENRIGKTLLRPQVGTREQFWATLGACIHRIFARSLSTFFLFFVVIYLAIIPAQFGIFFSRSPKPLYLSSFTLIHHDTDDDLGVCKTPTYSSRDPFKSTLGHILFLIAKPRT
ncbi:uncharacterized protein BDR25DRAFT_351359 [Lindgomyces ingoldianus]|uniref:Uncharacterized protein n=1 Tax=Lindgomyces ingoldianus TaxID=673940 RepID=A0ACB6R6P4_9PLEO|nr:uncharacterized protein BDR25DRAFT_351359 [Lindgomyces ingoldianus]KAF2474856.1 hypothetical protein BDR25DRAFT_351359 [Lindgomyces ingoldianus]